MNAVDLERDPHEAEKTTGRSRMRRILAVGVILLVTLLALRAPVSLYVVSPGPVFPLADALMIDAQASSAEDPIDGDFLFLTVQLDDARLLDTFIAAFDNEVEVVQKSAVLGGETEEEFIQRQEGLFDDAQAEAIRLGLALADSDLTESDVMIDTGGVGGPSAGLLTTLAVADLASPIDLAAGRRITGTGTVAPDGTVGPVGGVEDKIHAAQEAGADVFLVPTSLVDQAQAAETTMTLVPVTSVQDAFDQLARG